MSIDDIKKLPKIDDLRTAPIVEIAEIETKKIWYGQEQCDRFWAAVKGIYNHPMIDGGKQQLVIVPSIKIIDGKNCPCYTTQPLDEIVGYEQLKSL
ncbi:hypothetical protein HY484_04625 [Candidatus Woesearchaeota archaeon]|nr:hypothetical protein [Candidatus Woesearchaeota archaeon]